MALKVSKIALALTVLVLAGSVNAQTSSTDVLGDLELLPGQEERNALLHNLVSLGGDSVGALLQDPGPNDSGETNSALPSGELLFSRSIDGGLTWDEPVRVAAEGEFSDGYHDASIVRTDSGNLVAMVVAQTYARDGIDAGPYGCYFFSDDAGASWTTDEGNECDTEAEWRLIGPINGDVWRLMSDTSGVIYQTSVDGRSWSDSSILFELSAAAVNSDTTFELSDVVQTGPSSLLAVFAGEVGSGSWHVPPDRYIVGVRTSHDGGATWSPIRTLSFQGFYEAASPVVETAPDGTVYLVLEGGRDWMWTQQRDIYYATSEDGGETFSQPEQYSRYVGQDWDPSAAFAGDDLVVSFSSDRGRPLSEDGKQWPWIPGWNLGHEGPAWYGVVGRTHDANPPPRILRTGGYPKGSSAEDRAFIPGVQVYPHFVWVMDETGFSSVELHYKQGANEGSAPAINDGTHPDDEAGDDFWTAELGPFEFGEPVELFTLVTDAGGNVMVGQTEVVETAPIHTAGALRVAMTATGMFGDKWISWGEVGGESEIERSVQFGRFNYLHYGGLWVGSRAGQSVRVSYDFFNSGPGNWHGWHHTEVPSMHTGPPLTSFVLNYDDSDAETAAARLQVRQTTYQLDDWPFVIFEYGITNVSPDDLDEVYASIVLDPDMPLEFRRWDDLEGDDLVGFDADRSMIYAYDSGESCHDPAEGDPDLCTDVYLGTLLLNDGLGMEVSTPHTAKHWWCCSDGGGSAPSLDGMAPFYFMTSGTDDDLLNGNVEPDNWGMVLTARPHELPSGGSMGVAFALVAGNGLEELERNADEAIAQYKNVVVANEASTPSPLQFSLEPNYPNPFKPDGVGTTIEYSVAEPGKVMIVVYDLIGREVDRLVDETVTSGRHRVSWQASSVPSGVYVVRMQAGSFVGLRKVVLVR